MASRRNNLFSAYDAQTRTKSSSPSPYRPSNANGYGVGPPESSSSSSYRTSSATPSFGAYPQSSNASSGINGGAGAAFRSATPNSKGQYSDAVLNELENQNEQHLEGMSAKVAMLKSITTAIGDEIRDSSALAEKMNDSFENTRVRLKGTMNRMLRMAERTGISWKVWLGFFAAVILLFWWVRFL